MTPKNLLFLTSLLVISPASFAKGKLSVIALNSPVKESNLSVKLEGIEGIDAVWFKPKNGGIEVAGELFRNGSNVIGKFKGSALVPGAYEFRVKVRTASGGSSQNDAASVAFVKFEIDASLEVADPGDAGKKSLLGIDVDNDGVRDDVQRWINETYSGKESTKKALKQLSKVFSKRFTVLSSKQASIEAAYLVDEAVTCLDWIDIETGLEKNRSLRKIFNNTNERIKANLVAEGYLHGIGSSPKSLSVSWDNSHQLCDFPAQKND